MKLPAAPLKDCPQCFNNPAIFFAEIYHDDQEHWSHGTSLEASLGCGAIHGIYVHCYVDNLRNIGGFTGFMRFDHYNLTLISFANLDINTWTILINFKVFGQKYLYIH